MYTPLKNMKCQVFEATPIQGRHMFTSTLAHTQKLSLQCHHSSSYHDNNIVHHSGCCETSDWLSSRGSLARCGCCCARGRARSGNGMTNWSRTRRWSRSMSITRSGSGCSCGRGLTASVHVTCGCSS